MEHDCQRIMDSQQIIDKYYPADSRLRDIYMRHAKSVADKALDIARRKRLTIPHELIETAAMLHDIGIFMTNAPGIDCHGNLPYLAHGIAGADLLRREGVEESVASVAERHTGAGISATDIAERGLPLPPGDYMPRTQLERLICYADKFFSKSGDMKEKSLERVRASMAKVSPVTLDRFDCLHREFGSFNT